MGDPAAFYRSRSAPGDHVSPAYVAGRLQAILASHRVAGPVLDVGCGAGANLRVLQGRGPPIVGVDLSERALALAPRDDGVSLVVADGGRLPFEGRSFGFAVLAEVLEHVADPLLVVGEVGRVLRQDALLYVTSPNYANGAGLRKLWRDALSGRRDWNPWEAHRGGHEAFMTRGRLRALLRPWFDVLEEEGLDAGLGLTAGLAPFGRFGRTGLGERVLRTLGEGPLAGDRPLGRRLAMTTALLARRKA